MLIFVTDGLVNLFATGIEGLCCLRKQFGKVNLIVRSSGIPPVFYFRDSTLAQVESAGVAKVLQSEKNAMEILDTMDIETPKKCRNPNKNARNGRIGSSGK